ncbi:unnamed protein product [Cyprideis torosa]|uniref:M23ase beta-sheet core domain-containing protein n=1 Tax=Cyprideis torosa TaxID=163714 RepID=A0A7R8ZXU2_9CRUS|nr:unnamed protein product [Cyprideis torosa]CAG0907352.1 unnamed protein product [Cyprideis torosa]
MGLPVAGRIITRFNQPRNSVGRPNSGLELQTKGDRPIRAIHDGRVIYADAFRGYDRLVIVDHGDQYMSLYSIPGTLAVREGQNVRAGSELGTTQSGQSGKLYFEIRHQGDPIDPLQWCLTDRVVSRAG